MTTRRVVVLLGAVVFAACATVPPASNNPRLGVPADASPPAWANVLAGPLPATARTMLQLDHLQRAQNPLGTALAARLRLAAAEELGCQPVARAAAADLAAAHGGEAADAPARLAMAFARQATRAAHRIDDDTFGKLLAVFGAERTVAIVHTVAYASFLCRIVHGLGVDGPLPLGVLPDPAAPVPEAPARAAPAGSAPDAALGRLSWGDVAWDDLRAEQRRRQERTPRVPLPDEQRIARLEPRERESAGRIVWSRIAYGYQPELTRAWFRCLYTFYGEARLDAVFENSLFWVVTRTNDCFY